MHDAGTQRPDMSRDARRRRDRASTLTRDRAEQRRLSGAGASGGGGLVTFGPEHFVGAQSRQEFFDLYAEQAKIWQVEGLPGAEVPMSC